MIYTENSTIHSLSASYIFPLFQIRLIQTTDLESYSFNIYIFQLYIVCDNRNIMKTSALKINCMESEETDGNRQTENYFPFLSDASYLAL